MFVLTLDFNFLVNTWPICFYTVLKHCAICLSFCKFNGNVVLHNIVYLSLLYIDVKLFVMNIYLSIVLYLLFYILYLLSIVPKIITVYTFIVY
jgi:hypothetical protein